MHAFNFPLELLIACLALPLWTNKWEGKRPRELRIFPRRVRARNQLNRELNRELNRLSAR